LGWDRNPPQSFIYRRTDRARGHRRAHRLARRTQEGGREYRACCPFHNEKTPSFWVSPQKQFYHCFGCGRARHRAGFLMEYDKLSFPGGHRGAGRTARPRRAARGSSQPDNTGSTQPLYDLNLKVAKYFASVLPGDARAKEYAKKRGLTRETIDRFMIGFAPNSWNELLKRFGSTDADRKVLFDCG
jgi:DNA primase